MAVPRNATIHRPTPLKGGVILGISPSSDPTFDVEMQRATSSGTFTVVQRLTQKGGIPTMYTDILPVSTRSYEYRARAVKDGWKEGDFTASVSARPVSLPEFPPNITPLTGQTVGAPLFISTGAPVSYGTAASTGDLAKMLYVAGSDFNGITNAIAFRVGANYGTRLPTVAQTSTDFVYVGSVKVPLGVTIDKVGITYRRGSTVSVVGLRFDSVSTAGAVTTRFQKYSTAVSTGRLVLSSSSFSFTNTLNYVVLAVALRNNVVDSSTAIELAEGFIRYRIPNLNKTL